jgi:GT2 family glycosyltransferase
MDPSLDYTAQCPDSRVTVVIPTYNRLEKLRRCLESVLQSKPGARDTIVIDDASDPPVAPIVENEFPSTTVVRHTGPTFAAGCINDGIRMATTPYVLIINDDNQIDPMMIGQLAEGLDKNPRVGVLGPVTYLKSDPQRVMYTGAIFTKFLHRTVFPRLDGAHSHLEAELVEVENIPNCFMLRKEVAIKVGLIDAGIFVWTGEDGSLQDKIRLAGYSVNVLTNAKTFHDRDGGAGNDTPERYTPTKLFYTMRSKVAHVRLLELSTSKGALRLLVMPAFLSFYILKGLESATNSQTAMAAISLALRGTIAGMFLQRGTPYQ